MTNLKFIDSSNIKTIKRQCYNSDSYYEGNRHRKKIITHGILINGYFLELDTEKQRDKLFFKLLFEMKLFKRIKKEKERDKSGTTAERAEKSKKKRLDRWYGLSSDDIINASKKASLTGIDIDTSGMVFPLPTSGDTKLLEECRKEAEGAIRTQLTIPQKIFRKMFRKLKKRIL